MGSIPDPGQLSELTPPSFDEFQKQTSLMTSCTLLWKELSDHFSYLEQNIMKKAEGLKLKIQALDRDTKVSLDSFKERELTIDGSLEIALERAEKQTKAALMSLDEEENPDGVVDDGDGMSALLKSSSRRMEAGEFWKMVTTRKKEIDVLREKIPEALAECVDPPRFVLEAISEVFPVDKRGSERGNDLGWACVLMLESLIPVMVDPVIGNSRLLVTPKMRERANKIAETWKASLEERGGIENVKTPDVHTFLQHLVTFGIVKKEDLQMYRKLVVGSAWRKQMPKLAVSLGLGGELPEIIKELISRGQQLDAVHFSYEVGLVDRFPPVPLLKAYLRDAKKAAVSILEDPNNASRTTQQLAVRKEQSALRAVIKCIEDYKLEAEFPPENLKKRLYQLEKAKTEKKRPAAAPANKRTRASSNGGPMPPAKAGRLTNAYVSSFHSPPSYVRSPSQVQHPAPGSPYQSPQAVYANRSPSYVYSPETASPYAYSPEAGSPYAYSQETAAPLAGPYPGAPMNYPAYGGYCNTMASAYHQQAYYR